MLLLLLFCCFVVVVVVVFVGGFSTDTAIYEVYKLYNHYSSIHIMSIISWKFSSCSVNTIT